MEKRINDKIKDFHQDFKEQTCNKINSLMIKLFGKCFVDGRCAEACSPRFQLEWHGNEEEIKDEFNDIIRFIYDYDTLKMEPEDLNTEQKKQVRNVIKYNRKISIDKNTNNLNKIQKPFLKWVGGKTQFIDKIINHLPKEINNYHEIFLGGGSVLFAVLSLQKQGKIVIKNKIYAYDINKRLINTYKHIQKNHVELYKHLNYYFKEYDSIDGDVVNRNAKNITEAKTSKESYYFWIREKFRKIDIECVEAAALFKFINKT